MKALLKTLCGCSQLIDIPDRTSSIKIQLPSFTSQDTPLLTIVSSLLQSPVPKIRTFYLEHSEKIQNIEVFVYVEQNE